MSKQLALFFLLLSGGCATPVVAQSTLAARPNSSAAVVTAVPITCLPADSAEIVTLLSGQADSPIAFANHFLGRPYVAHTLEVNDDERLVVNTRQLDCTTLVETVTALTLCAQSNKRSFADYVRTLQRLRYRQGILDRYPSRLHYFSDWINDKQAMRLVTELQPTADSASLPSVSPQLFSGIQKLRINYMSKHPSAYKALKAHPEYVSEIALQEQALTGLTYRFIPKQKVRNTRLLRQTVHDGDIIAITCSKPGLDIAHLGFAVWQSDGLHLLNASQLHKKVVLEPMTLGQYLSKHPSHTGIRIIRINNK